MVLTYYPDADLLHKSVSSYCASVEKILVWENTPKNDASKYRVFSGDKFEYCSNGRNSISSALNYAWQYARLNGFDAILTMDQDSVFDNFGGYIGWAKDCQESDKCICSPWYFTPMQEDAVFSQQHVITA